MPKYNGKIAWIMELLPPTSAAGQHAVQQQVQESVGDTQKPTPNCSQFSAQQPLDSLRSQAIFKNQSENNCGKTAKHPATEREQEVLSGKGSQFHHTGKHILNLLMKFSEPSPVLNLFPHTAMKHNFF